MVLERDLRDKKATHYGRRTLWIGCHIDNNSRDLLTDAMYCLDRRIQQELHLSMRPEMNLLGLAWDGNQVESQHFGVMFHVPVVNDYVADHLKNKQFKKMGRAGRIKSVFMTQEEISCDLAELDLEPWSQHMTRNIKLTPEKDADA